MAREHWENHLARNRSVVVDLFYGQLKSKVTCKVCGHESVKFDPFTSLSLPLPMETSVHIEAIGERKTRDSNRLYSCARTTFFVQNRKCSPFLELSPTL